MASSINYIKQLQTQARASGYGSIITDQNRSELADFVLNNLSCQIMLNLVSPREIRATGYSMGCNEEQVKEIRNLKIPYAIISFSGHPPFKIKISKSPVKRHISDSELEKLMKPRLAALPYNPRQKPQITKIQLSETKDPGEDRTKEQNIHDLLKEIKNFLFQIKNFPELNITQLYSSLNLSGRKGDKLKKQLLANGLIREEIINSGKRQRPSKRLKLMEKGEKLFLWLEKKVKAE